MEKHFSLMLDINVHRALKMAAAETGIPMAKLAVDVLKADKRVQGYLVEDTRDEDDDE